ncbi:MAG: RNA-guided endonuclease InsQ/TnpB family protein [Ktedonobacterales bacterium]
MWHPRTTTEWTTFTASRKEAARLWGDLVVRHHRIRRLGWKWPSKARWQRWAKGRYPGISAQSTQQLIGEFCEAVDSCRQLRGNGRTEARYPWRKPRYHDVVYTNQDARIRAGRLILPHGTSGPLRIHLPETVTLPGRLLEVRLSYGVVRLVCEVLESPRPQQTVIGVDLGVNTLIAATDGTKVFLVSGRGVKAVIQWRNKTLADIQQAQSSKTKGSLRWKRLQRRKYQMLGKTKRQVRDATHKATHVIAEAFPGATCYVGEPFNDAAQRTGRVPAQHVSTACNRKLIEQLNYKTAGAIAINEAYSSQTCPVCGERSKHRRVYRCPHCGVTGPRDAVGAVNILSLGQHGAMLPGRTLPQQVKYLRPWRSSSGGHTARSSA